MADIEHQLRRLYQDYGMEPKEIDRNENLGYWKVAVQAEDSDERFHDPKGEIGASKPVDYGIDFTAVKAATRREIDGARILAGTVNLERFESEYAHLTVSKDD